MKLRKVGIIGTGHVGSHVAFSLALQGEVDELYMMDIDEKKAKDYWKIVCQIFSPAHTFDHETYEGLINSLKQEI